MGLSPSEEDTQAGESAATTSRPRDSERKGQEQILSAGTKGCFEGRHENQSLSGKGKKDKAAPDIRAGKQVPEAESEAICNEEEDWPRSVNGQPSQIATSLQPNMVTQAAALSSIPWSKV